MIERGFWASERLRALESANEIAQAPVFDDSPERWAAQASVANVALWSAEPERCLRLSQQVLHLAEQSQVPQQLMLAHCLVGSARWLRSDLVQARDHLEQALVVGAAGDNQPVRPLKEQGAARPESQAAARRMLAGIYTWFSEGFDMLDLREARELLEELNSQDCSSTKSRMNE